MVPTILVTGANRGIGAALAESYLRDGWTVIGASRSGVVTQPEIEALKLDVTDPASIAAAVQQLDGRAIDILWNNAGVYLDKGVGLDGFDDATWLESFAVNTVAPLRLADALRGNVARSDRRVFAFTTSKMGSVGALNGGNAYAYRSSKTALNMAVNCFALEHAAAGINCLLLHPGWVRTDMGGSAADIDVATSVNGMRGVVDQAAPDRQPEFNGRYFNYDGASLPW